MQVLNKFKSVTTIALSLRIHRELEGYARFNKIMYLSKSPITDSFLLYNIDPITFQKLNSVCIEFTEHCKIYISGEIASELLNGLSCLDCDSVGNRVNFSPINKHIIIKNVQVIHL